MDHTTHHATEQRPEPSGPLAKRPGRAADRRAWPWGRAIGVVLVAVGSASCSLDSLLNSNQLPPNVSDPAITQTPDGARAAYTGTLAQFRAAVGGDDQSVIVETGLLSDELSSLISAPLDQRILPEGGGGIALATGTYSLLQRVRGQAGQAIGLLATYVPDQPALRGHLYALEGYAELFLAELFCSGIPLSTLDYNGDFTYKPGSTTTAVLIHATALFDTALALAGDNTRLAQLAQVGRARALLGLDSVSAAAAAVAAIPDGYHYDVTFYATTADSSSTRNFARVLTGQTLWDFTVPDQEGGNGLDWRSSKDPRTTVTFQGTTSGIGASAIAVYHPDKYAVDGSTSIVVASGVEARLIGAEAQLQMGGDWLGTLNALRTDGTFETQPNAQDNTKTDTLWHAGSGGVAGLRPLADPDASAPAGPTPPRVDLLFRERGFWLFLTGHRQGDLRRLIRQYGRDQSTVYPVGPYITGFPYGGDVTVPIPATESVNPLFTGCASRGA